MFGWPWFRKPEGEISLGYAITHEPMDMSGVRSFPLAALMREGLDREAVYSVAPHLRPAPDPYIWIDPFEER